MQDYQKRVIQERNELKVKLDALLSFIESDGFDQLVEKQADLMHMQCDAMERYFGALNDRIEDFNLESEEIVTSIGAITEGMYRVGIDFNPGGHEKVTHLKTTVAKLIDYVLVNGKDKRTASMAATAFEQACMDAVKSVTKPNRPAHLLN